LDQIVGYFGDAQSVQTGFVYAGGAFSTLNVSPGRIGAGFDINNSGQIVGGYITAGRVYGFEYQNNVIQLLVYPSAVQTYAYGDNNLGDVVGWYFNGQKYGAYSYSAGSYQDIVDPLAVNGEIAYDINDMGDVVGLYYDTANNIHAFERVGGVFTTIDPPGANVGFAATGINDSGEIVIESVLGDSYLLQGGRYTKIDDPLGTRTYALHINSQGDVIGSYYDANGVLHGFLYGEDDPTVSPPYSVPPTIAPPIVPVVPEPTTWVLMVLGLGGLGTRLRFAGSASAHAANTGGGLQSAADPFRR
jgi:uncharacterized membrane protein